jgi:hypothetical protein
MPILKNGYNNRKCLAFTTLVRLILDYGVVCWDLHSEGQVSALNRMQKRAAKFENNINKYCWENMAQRRFISKGMHRGTVLKAIGERFLKPCYLSRTIKNREIRTRKRRIDVREYFFVNRAINSWNQLPGSLQTSTPFKINTFRNRVNNLVTSKGIRLGVE